MKPSRPGLQDTDTQAVTANSSLKVSYGSLARARHRSRQSAWESRHASTYAEMAENGLASMLLRSAVGPLGPLGERAYAGNGVPAHGGSINGPAPVAMGGMLYVTSGDYRGRTGNLLLALGVDQPVLR